MHLNGGCETRDTAKAAMNIPQEHALGVQIAVSLETTVVVLHNATNPSLIAIYHQDDIHCACGHSMNPTPYHVMSAAAM